VTSGRIVFASGNAGKLRECVALFASFEGTQALEVVPQSALGIQATDEPYATFVENALAKARHAAAASGLPALADDSGLCVDALGGAPGVLSARFSGEPVDDERNNMELLWRLAGITQRDAHYVCVMVALRAANDPAPLIADARWNGEILQAPRGDSGFGYDPLFQVSGLGVTAAELDLQHKNRISHRGLAFSALAERLTDWR